MMEAVLFTVVAIALYFLSDRILDGMERVAGRRFEYRTIIFFGLLLGLALVSFALIRHFTGMG